VIHDRELLDRLSDLPRQRLQGLYFRATGVTVDPTASSISGGRWSPRPDSYAGVPALYTSFKRDGALAELCTFLADITPIPNARLIKVTSLDISLTQTVRLGPNELKALAVDLTRYGQRDYGRTQQIGAALSFLGVDGLIAPSARWKCDNLVVFQDNHNMIEGIKVRKHEKLDWRVWAQANGIVTTAKGYARPSRVVDIARTLGSRHANHE
jgi:RES domain-containing protein